MVQQLVEADLELFTKLMNDIQNNIVEGLAFRNVDQSITNKLIKIVLQKINKQV
jgi:predicted sugar kinase